MVQPQNPASASSGDYYAYFVLVELIEIWDDDLDVLLNYTDHGNEIYTCTAPNTFQYSQAKGLRTDVSINGSSDYCIDFMDGEDDENGDNVTYTNVAFDFDGVGIGGEFILLVKLDLFDNTQEINWTMSKIETFLEIYGAACEEAADFVCFSDDCDYLIGNVTYGYGYNGERYVLQEIAK